VSGSRERARSWVAGHRLEVGVLATLTTAFVLLCLVFSVLVPMFGNFDEQTHLDRARYTAREPIDLIGPGPELRITHGSWEALATVRAGPEPRGSDGAAHRQLYRPFRDYPGGDEPDVAPCPGGVCQNIQYGHPPGWYLLAAPVTAVLEGQSFPRQVLALRLLDIALAIPLVALAWATAREVWPRSRRRPLAAAAVVASMGPLAYTASAVNNDGLLLLAMAVAMAAGARILRRGQSVPANLVFGLAVGIGLFTKVQMVLAAPVFGLMVLAAPATGIRQRLRCALAFGVPAGLGAWWWFRQLILDGSPLSPDSSELLRPPVPGPWTGASYPRYAFRKLPTLFDRVWGTYMDPVTFAPGWVQGVLGTATIVLALGWLIRRRWRVPALADLRWLLLPMVPAALVAGTLYASVDAYRRTGELRALTPRYLYPSAAFLAIGVVAAIATSGRGLLRGRVARWALPVATVAFGLGAGPGSVARSVQSSYATTSWSDIATRASAIGPLNHAGPVVVVLGLAWLAALAGAAVLMLRLPVADEP
jgi:4-amino-4-deoxy-L-arabinose transferase-like glycosyltransferase